MTKYNCNSIIIAYVTNIKKGNEKMSEKNAFCPVCSAPLQDEVATCAVCGADLSASYPSQEQESGAIYDTGPHLVSSRPINSTRRRNIHKTASQNGDAVTEPGKNIIVGAVALLLSFVLLILNFLPIFSMRAAWKDELSVVLRLSVLDGVIMGVDSMHFSNSKQIYSSDLYQETQKLKSDLASLDTITIAQSSRIFKNELRLALRNDMLDFNANILFNAICCAAYMIFSAATFILVLSGFLSLLLKKKTKCDFVSRVLSLCTFLPVLYFFFRLAFNFGVTSEFSAFFGSEYSMGWGLIATLCIAVASIAFFIVYSIKNAVKKPPFSKYLSHGFAALLTFILILSPFLPILNLVPQDDTEDLSFEVLLADNNILTSSESYHYETISIPETKEAVYSSCEEYGAYLDGSISRHSAAFIEKNITEHLMRSRMIDNASASCILALLSTPLFLFFCGTLLKKEVLFLLSGADEVGVKKSKKLCLVFSALLAAAMIVPFVSALSSIDFYDFEKAFSAELGIGFILLIISSVLLSLTFIKPAVRKDSSPEYENADTSYAPYVANIPENFSFRTIPPIVLRDGLFSSFCGFASNLY